MNMRKLSINKACILWGTLLLLAVGAVCAAVYLLTQNITAVRCVFLFSLFVLLCVIFFVALIRRKLVRFSDAFCGQMDDMLSGDMQPKQTVEEETCSIKSTIGWGGCTRSCRKIKTASQRNGLTCKS